jgi:hypothetical protein
LRLDPKGAETGRRRVQVPEGLSMTLLIGFAGLIGCVGEIGVYVFHSCLEYVQPILEIGQSLRRYQHLTRRQLPELC